MAKQQQVGSHMAFAPFVNLVKWKFESEASKSAERNLPPSIIYGASTKGSIFNLGQKVWKAFKFVPHRRFSIVHLHITVVKVLRKTLIAMWQTLCQNYSRQELYQRFSLAVAAFSSVRAWYVEVIAGQFQCQGQKISQHRIHLQNLRNSDGFSCLLKIWAGASVQLINIRQNTTPWSIFRKDGIVGVSLHWISFPRRPKKRLRWN